jgi:hypothetical protein
MYPNMVINRVMNDHNLLNHALAAYTPINPNTMCPALILAASRNDRVRGRTKMLVVSISTRKGLSQSGAPSGRKWAIDFIGLLVKVDKIILIHRGRPNLRVKMRCLDMLKMYGISPMRLMIIMIENKDEINVLRPLRLTDWVRIN